MTFEISTFIRLQHHKNSAYNVDQGNVETFDTFEKLGNKFSKCKKGGKFDGHWVRAALSPMYRKDGNMGDSNLLVIDGDEGPDGRPLSSPRLVHLRLKDLGYNHFLYTSHSHAKDKNKFRCVVQSESFDREAMKLMIVDLLFEMRLDIKLVREMKSFSQCWYNPYRDDPADNLFEFYSYYQGVAYEQKKQEEQTHEEESQETSSSEGTSNRELLENIRTGKEFHQSINNLVWQMAKDGVNKSIIIGLIESTMEQSEDSGSDRWMTRLKEIPRSVEGAIVKVADQLEADADFDMDDIGSKNDHPEFPKPPGMYGELFDCCLAGMKYQHSEFAFTAVTGMLAGIGGRRFNVSPQQPTGLNMFLTVIAPTGSGKESMSRFIHRVLLECSLLGDNTNTYESFIGSNTMTSIKAFYNDFVESKSRVCIMTEAGIMMKTKSGDIEGKTMAILNAYNASGSQEYTASQQYSSKEDRVPSMRAIAMTIISESTGEQLIDAYRQTGAVDSGYLPRQLVLRISNLRPKANKVRVQPKLPEHIVNRLKLLLDHCSTVQAQNDPLAHLFVPNESVWDKIDALEEKYDGIYNEYIGVDKVKAQMATRVVLKALRLSGIATMINKDKDDPLALLVEDTEWDYAQEVVEYEYDQMTYALEGLTGSSDMGFAIRDGFIKMKQLLDGKVRNKRAQLSKYEVKNKIIKVSTWKEACKNLPSMGKVESRFGKYKSGPDKVLEYMESTGAISIIQTVLHGKGKMIKVEQEINDFIKGIN